MIYDWNDNFNIIFHDVPPIGLAKRDDMRKAGYPEAKLNDANYHRWSEVHEWCKVHFSDRYTWCGQSFFFTNDSDKVLFAMRWS